MWHSMPGPRGQVGCCGPCKAQLKDGILRSCQGVHVTPAERKRIQRRSGSRPWPRPPAPPAPPPGEYLMGYMSIKAHGMGWIFLSFCQSSTDTISNHDQLNVIIMQTGNKFVLCGRNLLWIPDHNILHRVLLCLSPPSPSYGGRNEKLSISNN